MKNSAIINLERIRENAIAVKKAVGDKKFCAVVKDDGYGHGIVEVANCLYKVADYYAVALLEEGITLRQAGIDKPILMLVPCPRRDLESAIYYGMTLSVSSLLQVKEIEFFAEKSDRRVKVHIQFDSGMNRCGTKSFSEIEKICSYCNKSEFVFVEGIYSHLACPDKKKKTKKQVDKFLLAIKCAMSYNKDIISHISASGGVIEGLNFDMVRVGLMLYGYKPFKCNIKLQPAMKVVIPVIKEVELKPFDGALYGLKRTLRRRRLALIRLGYGDGLKRAKVKGQFSNKCMDLSLVDLKETVNGYYVVSDFDAEAKKNHTVSYEIMVNISKRCERIYKDN